MLALVDNQPRQLSLRQLLEEFLKFREQTLTRQYDYELRECQTRLHLLEGLLIALNHLDEVINILRNAPDGTTAKVQFQRELNISDAQANGILAMPMRRLTGLERQKLQGEYDELQNRINELQTLLSDRHELLKGLKKELRSLKRKFGDERRTRIIQPTPTKNKPQKSSGENVGQETTKKTEKTETKSSETVQPFTLFTPQTPPKDAILEITDQGTVAWRSPKSNIPDSSPPIYRQAIKEREQFVVITDSGKAYPVAVQDVPPADIQPIPLLSLLPKSAQRDANKVIDAFFLPETTETQDLLLLTQQGKIKRIQLSELENLTNRGLVVIKLKDDDRLHHVSLTAEGQTTAIAMSSGRILRFPVIDEQIPIMGRNAQGNQAFKLRYGETLTGCVTLAANQTIVLVSQLGYGKQIKLTELRVAKFGDIGTQALQFTDKTDSLVAITSAPKKANLTLLTTQNRTLQVPVTSIKLWGKDGTGDQLIKLKNKEMIHTAYLS